MTTPLIATARALMAPGKGLLAMDESVGTCNRRRPSLASRRPKRRAAAIESCS